MIGNVMFGHFVKLRAFFWNTVVVLEAGEEEVVAGAGMRTLTLLLSTVFKNWYIHTFKVSGSVWVGLIHHHKN